MCKSKTFATNFPHEIKFCLTNLFQRFFTFKSKIAPKKNTRHEKSYIDIKNHLFCPVLRAKSFSFQKYYICLHRFSVFYKKIVSKHYSKIGIYFHIAILKLKNLYNYENFYNVNGNTACDLVGHCR